MTSVFVAGHKGMVGSAVARRLRADGVPVITADRKAVDLRDQNAVAGFFAAAKPETVVVAAAKVGGIHANHAYPAEFIYDNLAIAGNLIHAAWQAGCARLLFLGSSCVYPKFAGQPIKEEALLTGALEPTNEPYALAKIAGIKLCESYNRQYGADFRSLMPTNLYGIGDNFHLENSHVAPALMHKMHMAKETGAAEVAIWGSGNARREFLHVDDLADACVHILNLDKSALGNVTEPMRSHLNVGTGTDVTIRELAETIAAIVGYRGKLRYDASKPDGAPRRLLDVSRIDALGWRAQISLQDGLRSTYEWFLANRDSIRA